MFHDLDYFFLFLQRLLRGLLGIAGLGHGIKGILLDFGDVVSRFVRILPPKACCPLL